MKYMDIEEFIEFGYLQEVNRQWFHPLGLALTAVSKDEGKSWTLRGIMDVRDEPDGVIFTDSMLNEERSSRVAEELAKRAVSRINSLGYIVQPIEDMKGEA